MKFERGAGSGRKASACRILCGLNGHAGKISVSRQSGMVVIGSGPRWLHPYPGWTKISFPIYLEPDVNDYLNRIAEEKKLDLQALVNELLRTNIKIAQVVER